MAMPIPEKVSLSQVLRLVNKLSQEEQQQLFKEVQLLELRREIMIGVEQIEQGEGIPGEQAFDELQARHNELVIKTKNKK